jgi:Ni/Co efflux regulator RcnB
MHKLMTLSLLAASLVPAAAQAQASRGELARDRHEVHEDRRDLNRAYRQGDRHDVRDARHDLRDSRHELNEDWRDYRRGHASIYHRGNWHAPFRYERFAIGRRLAPLYYGPRFVIANPGYYRLPPAYGSTRWVRHYDDVLLIDIRTGIVREVIRGFYW